MLPRPWWVGGVLLPGMAFIRQSRPKHITNVRRATDQCAPKRIFRYAGRRDVRCQEPGVWADQNPVNAMPLPWPTAYARRSGSKRIGPAADNPPALGAFQADSGVCWCQGDFATAIDAGWGWGASYNAVSRAPRI